MQPIAKILLATDLSARSDRAMDRAALLRRQWQAEVIVLHVVESAAATRVTDAEMITRARRELCALLEEAGARVSIRIERGDPAEVIRRVARDEACSMIVTGVARNESFGHIKLGETIDGVIRGLEIPLLAVTRRAREPYGRVAIAVDFSDVSRKAVEVTTALFPDATTTVFHAHGAPGSYASTNLADFREQAGRSARAELDEFMGPLPDALRRRLAIRVEHGDPARQVFDWTQSADIELVGVGTRGRGRIGEFFLGSVAKGILAQLPCDVLLVPSGSMNKVTP